MSGLVGAAITGIIVDKYGQFELVGILFERNIFRQSLHLRHNNFTLIKMKETSLTINIKNFKILFYHFQVMKVCFCLAGIAAAGLSVAINFEQAQWAIVTVITVFGINFETFT